MGSIEQDICNELVSLGSRIDQTSKLLQQLMTASALELPTWDEDTAAEFPEDGKHGEQLQKVRYELIDLCARLERLAKGPTEHVKSLISNAPIDIASMRFIVNYGVAAGVPFGRDIHIDALARGCQVDGQVLLRVLRYCTTNGVFRETQARYFAHTAASAHLARGQLSIAMRWSVEVIPAAALRMTEAARHRSPCDSPRSCGFNVEYGTRETYWEYQERKPELAAMFSDNMATESGTMRLSPKHVVRGFAWQKIGAGTVVDVGGSNGHVSMAIAQEHPALSFIVQDETAEIESWQERLPAEFADRITYQRHNFFTPQRIKADVYFYRYILHNWADHDVLKILAALTGALEPGSRLLVCEYIGPSGGPMGEFEERTYRLRDLQMLAFLGAKERSLDDYKVLVGTAQPRLQFVGFETPVGSSMSVMEWVYI
ncbi:O-methyltransferase [Phlyctema vagabunda]|uniref:O-methyltransferase n=1 Tax=Phlyctema vagabunda TaxID=108571 RepID=A0ABR4PB30_9HELO